MASYTFRDAVMDVCWDCQISEPAEYKLGDIRHKSGIIFSIDKIFKKQPAPGPRCDELVIFDKDPKTTGVHLIERKSGNNSNVEKARQQLQGGADFINRFSKKESVPINDLFYLPVLVSKRASRSITNKLKTTMVTLNNQQKYIRHVQTGKSLP